MSPTVSAVRLLDVVIGSGADEHLVGRNKMNELVRRFEDGRVRLHWRFRGRWPGLGTRSECFHGSARAQARKQQAGEAHRASGAAARFLLQSHSNSAGASVGQELGLTSGLSLLLVLALYTNGSDVRILNRHPGRPRKICPLLHVPDPFDVVEGTSRRDAPGLRSVRPAKHLDLFHLGTGKRRSLARGLGR